MSEEKTETAAKSVPEKRRDPIVTTVAVLLLIAAAVMYVKDIRDSRAAAASANEIRARAAYPSAALMMSFSPEGRKFPVIAQCSPLIFSNTVAALQLAEPAKIPEVINGTQFELTLVYTNASKSVFFAVVPEDEKLAGNILIGLKTPTEFDEKKMPVKWTVGPAVKIADKDGMLAGMLKEVSEKTVNLPTDAQIAEMISNKLDKAETPAVKSEEAEPPADSSGAE